MKLRDRRKNTFIRCVDAPGLLLTCKQIYSEATGIYYSMSTFEVWYSSTRLARRSGNTTTRLPEFLHGIGKAKRDLITALGAWSLWPVCVGRGSLSHHIEGGEDGGIGEGEPVYTGEPVKTYREYLARPKKEKEERQREREGRRQKMLERMRELRARERKGNGKVRTKAKAKRGLEKVAGSAS
ncbi:hypothetical protein CLAFUW4_12599 [Fulvia fulva]|uniref:Uncharacterized protein n=1 Tax=Passalora fulva TaxID=5499 RepID=A0A9Q8USE5_PASFU|nr:uncharacterized protein CLAFUR5_11624 [Fulvia fulva]KAK4617469.1 hypothetical protein CLAFUR4_12604 [Fulvia fulva]KAK4618533.1 hypothetical protein CLAFUR0_12615 [Fulvia fulva]UJO20754.1 hypothetical protein CLAFUR5_11624 [Fulvia fulva]WPV18465.1 hypothetical protein CLAFUW4_12599 [Fulvia fulva]WPV33434.1 hypothetical protein CLAFUW7_12606 [Fulvia fulva]